MPSAHEKQKALAKVLSSSEFASADLARRLLEYLVNASDRGSRLKETTIAFEFFGRQENYDPSTDAYVRSAIYKLRKKLEHYYEHDGKNDRVRIVIPKGQYHVEFQRNRAREGRKELNFANVRLYKGLSVALAGALFFLIIFHELGGVFRPPPSKRLAASPAWSDIFESPSPVLAVIGDVFMFLEYRKDLDSWRLVAEPYVIDASDLKSYMNRFPGEEVYFCSSTMIPRSTVTTLSALMPFFHENHKPLAPKLSSRLQWEDFNRNSILYLGGTSGLHLLRNVITLTHFRFRPVNKYFIINAKKDTVLRFSYKDPGTLSDVYRDEYAYVGKIPGPDHNVVFFFIGMAYNSRVSSLRKFLDLDFLGQLETLFTEKYGHFPRYFEVLWKVGGYREAAYEHKIVYYASLEGVTPRTP